MLVEENEVRQNGGQHVEISWTRGAARIYAKLFNDRLECFWYTTQGLTAFVNYLESQSVGVAATARATDEQGMEFDTISQPFQSFLAENSLESIGYFEVDLGGARLYWCEESPPIEQSQNPDYLVHVNCSYDQRELLRDLYTMTGPEFLTRENRGRLISDVLSEIKERVEK